MRSPRCRCAGPVSALVRVISSRGATRSPMRKVAPFSFKPRARSSRRGIARVMMAHHPASRSLSFPSGRRLFLAAFLLVAIGASFALAQVGFIGRRALLTGNLPQAIAAADLNGDGKVDLVVANGASDDVSIFLGVGGGIFRPQVKKAAGGFPSDVVLAAGLCFGGTNAGGSCTTSGDCPAGGTCKIGFNTGNATRTCVGGTNPGAT